MFFKAIITASAIVGLAAAGPFRTNTTTSACPTLCVDAINDCGVICYPVCSPELYPTPPPCTRSTPITTPTISLITPTPDPITNSTL
ncbi:uncharacterized protein Y057_12506 [Fusarium fujikuroi]|nr:uncharacterized protein Y057_12506 [Fusarium fujikuroi]